MVRVHGAGAQQLSARTRGVPLEKLVAVAVDVGGSTAAAMVCDVTGQVLVAPFEFAMNRVGVAELAARVDARLPAATRLVRVGVEAAGHYHRPLLAGGVLPAGWQVIELNPAWVTAQRRVNGSRGVKTTGSTWPRSVICCWPAAAMRCTQRSTRWSSWRRGSRTAAAAWPCVRRRRTS